MFDQEKYREKIRDHLSFLISSGVEKKELQNKCQWSERRLARYLTKNEVSDKQLSITLKDLYYLSQLEECHLGVFVSQLNPEEKASDSSLNAWQKKCLTIFGDLIQEERNTLLNTLLNQHSDHEKYVKILKLIAHMKDLSHYELETISRVIQSFAV